VEQVNTFAHFTVRLELPVATRNYLQPLLACGVFAKVTPNSNVKLEMHQFLKKKRFETRTIPTLKVERKTL